MPKNTCVTYLRLHLTRMKVFLDGQSKIYLIFSPYLKTSPQMTFDLGM